MVGAVQGLAAVGELLHGRHRLPRVPVGPDVRGVSRLRAGEPLRRRRCSSASPSRARRSTSSTRRTCDVPLRGARLRRRDRHRRRPRRVRHRRLPGCSSPSACRPTAAPTTRRHHHRRSRSRVRRSSSSRSGSAIRSCRRAWCATARSSSRVASRSTSPAISPSASGSLAFASSTSSRHRGCSSPAVRPWDLTIASIRPRRRRVGHRRSQRSVPRHRSGGRAAARPAAAVDARRPPSQDHLCACVAATVPGRSPAPCAPFVKPILASSETRLLELVQTGACDAALVDAGSVGQFVAGRGGILGPVSARVERGGGYVVAVTRGRPHRRLRGRSRPRADARGRHDAPARPAVARDRPGPSAAAALSPSYSAASPVTAGRALHGKMIQSSVRRQTYSHLIVVRDFS